MMTEQTALFLASLSHKWSLVVLSLPVVFGLAAYGAGVLQARARAGANARARQIANGLRVASCTLLGVSIAASGVSFFHVGCATLKAHSVRCMSNVKALALGSLMYAEDYDQRLPPTAHWAEAIDSRVQQAAEKETPSIRDDPFHCPAAESTASYGMNAALNSESYDQMEAPADTVMLFDADAPVRSFAGGARDIARTRHNNAPNLAFVDGHARFANAFVLDKLTWAPTEASGQKQARP
jgi:prepilin-type processing-associated H-X9-DG protein